MRSFDVVVLGGGYTGPLTALVLARMGHSVCLLERGPVPRLALGESTRNEQNRIHADLARAYDLPELLPFTSYTNLKKSGLPIPTWPKEAFYFLTNPALGPDRGGVPAELVHQTTPWPVGPDYHVRRDAFDVCLLDLARRRGATVIVGAEIAALELGDDEVRCAYRVAPAGERRNGDDPELRAKFFVDATGHGAFLARHLGVHDADPSFIELQSRTIYGHFMGVRSLDDVMRSAPWAARHQRLPIPRDHATMHHLDHEGWTWVIPFEGGLTSVGLVLNQERDLLDHDSLSPSEAFFGAVSRNPALAAVLDGAEPVAPLRRSGRLQWAARAMVGPRWAMLPPACGFSDALLSPGMTTSAASVARFALRIGAVLRGERVGTEALADVESRFRIELEYHARILHSLFMAAGNAELFAAIQTVDRLATHLGGLLLAGREGGAAGDVPVLFGLGEEPVRALVDRVHGALLAAGGTARAPEGLEREIREIVADGDLYGFTRSRFDRTQRAEVHVHELRGLVSWVSGLRTAPDSRVSDGVRASSRRWLDSFSGLLLRAPRMLLASRRAPRARTRGLAWRHLLIQLGIRT